MRTTLVVVLPTAVKSQKCAWLTSIRTRSIASLKSKAPMNAGAEAKKTWPDTR